MRRRKKRKKSAKKWKRKKQNWQNAEASIPKKVKNACKANLEQKLNGYKTEKNWKNVKMLEMQYTQKNVKIEKKMQKKNEIGKNAYVSKIQNMKIKWKRYKAAKNWKW